MKNKNEHLEQLLRQFVDQDQVRQMADDIHSGDRLFDAHPAPSVRPETLAAVQQNAQHQLRHTHRVHSRMQWVAAAAVVALLLAGLLALYTPTNDLSPNPFGPLAAGEWHLNQNLGGMDQSLAEIENELSSLTEVIDTMDTGTYEPINPLQLEWIELEEIEAMASSTEFWKG